MNETPIEALKQDVEGLHDCKARHTATEYVTETFEGETVWEGYRSTHLWPWKVTPKRLSAMLGRLPTKKLIDAVSLPSSRTAP